MNNSFKSISIIASVITVINFALSIILSFDGLSFNIFPTIADSFETKPLFFRIIIFLLLEVLISFVFVKIYLLLNAKMNNASPISLVLKTILFMCSAWTTLFNVKWIILSYFTDRGAWVVFLIVASLIANFIWTYWYTYQNDIVQSDKLKPRTIFFIHALFLGLVFGILIIDKSF